MPRQNISAQTIKKLFALSGNQCAFPKCNEVMVQDETIVGEIAHIEAANPGGKRYNLQQSDEDRAAFENLILLCPKHHKIIDNVEEFSVARLQAIKKDHESQFADSGYKLPEQLISTIVSSEKVMIGIQGVQAGGDINTVINQTFVSESNTNLETKINPKVKRLSLSIKASIKTYDEVPRDTIDEILNVTEKCFKEKIYLIPGIKSVSIAKDFTY